MGVIPNISANFACVIFDLAISASKFGNTASLPFSIFRDYDLKYTRIIVIVNMFSRFFENYFFIPTILY